MTRFDIKLPEPIVLSVLSDAGAFEPEDISDCSLSPPGNLTRDLRRAAVFCADPARASWIVPSNPQFSMA
jgi:hypothetical protein